MLANIGFWTKGYTCAVYGFTYIPPNCTAEELAEWAEGYREGMKVASGAVERHRNRDNEVFYHESLDEGTLLDEAVDTAIDEMKEREYQKFDLGSIDDSEDPYEDDRLF